MIRAPLELYVSPDELLAENLETLELAPQYASEILAAQSEGTLLTSDEQDVVLLRDGCELGRGPSPLALEEQIGQLRSDEVAVVFGLGLGHTVLALRHFSDAPCIVYDPCPGLARVALSSAPLALGRTRLVGNYEELLTAWHQLVPNAVSARLLVTAGYEAAFPDAAIRVREEINRLVQRNTASQSTISMRGRAWVEHIVRNLDLLTQRPLLQSLQGAFSKTPAFIVGAGPSLDKNVRELAIATQKGIVICANSSAAALAHAGVQAQMLCCLESIDLSDTLKDNPLLDSAVRVLSLSSHPNNLRVGSGPLLPFFEGLWQLASPLQQLTGHPGLTVAGSVSSAAFSTALLLGCDPIVLVGQDMSYPNGRAYATGTGYEQSTAAIDDDGQALSFAWSERLIEAHGTQFGRRQVAEPLHWLPGWGQGPRVASGVSLSAVHRWFSDAAAELRGRSDSPRLVNATEGGAHVPGFEDVPLRDLLLTLPERALTPDDINAAATLRGNTLTTEQLATWAETQILRLKTSRTRAQEFTTYSENALSTLLDPKTLPETFERLDTADAQLRKAVHNTPLLDAWVQGAVCTLLGSQDAGPRGPDQTLRLGTALASTLNHSALELESLLQQFVGGLNPTNGPTKGISTCRC